MSNCSVQDQILFPFCMVSLPPEVSKPGASQREQGGQCGSLEGNVKSEAST